MQLASRNYETQWQPKLCAISEARAKNGKNNTFASEPSGSISEFSLPRLYAFPAFGSTAASSEVPALRLLQLGDTGVLFCHFV